MCNWNCLRVKGEVWVPVKSCTNSNSFDAELSKESDFSVAVWFRLYF